MKVVLVPDDDKESGKRGGLPVLTVDMSRPDSRSPAPTTLNVPASVVDRFEQALPPRTTHAALVFDAVRSHAGDLPELVLKRRPQPRKNDPFPLRAAPVEQKRERPGTLRVRPVQAEMVVLDRLVTWVNRVVQSSQPGSRRVSRSELVAAALDAYLPPLKKTKK